MENQTFLNGALIYLTAAVFAVPIAKALGLGAVLGYLVAGSILGPWGLKLVGDPQGIGHFAELGVVFLMFVIGLELKPSRLWSLRKAVFGMGAVQVGISALILGGGAYYLGLPPLAATIVGVGLSLSSTAFAMQLLEEKNQLKTPHGQSAFAILLFQDLAVIPLLAIIPLLAKNAASPEMAPPLVIAAVILSITFGGRFVLKPLFRVIARARAKEIFTAASLLLVLGIALLMRTIGLSMALGAFLAGVILADSEYRHELEADIEPFKGLLLGLFFMSVGMTVDYGLLADHAGMVVLGVIALLVIKGAVIIALSRMAKLGAESSINMAVTISQGGEFAFVLFGIAAAAGLLSATTAGLLVLVVTLSMAITPLLVLINERVVVPRLCPVGRREFDEIKNEKYPVLIAGYGRMGQIPARVLTTKGFDFTALEHDPEHVSVVLKYGVKIYYGDASRIDLLEAAGAKTAKIFILAIDDVDSSLRTAEIVRHRFPHLKIFARARNRTHAHQLMDLGITLIYRETFATSLELTRDVLRELGETTEQAAETIRRFREHDEKFLAEQHKVHKNEQELINFSKRSTEQLMELFRTDKV